MLLYNLVCDGGAWHADSRKISAERAAFVVRKRATELVKRRLIGEQEACSETGRAKLGLDWTGHVWVG